MIILIQVKVKSTVLVYFQKIRKSAFIQCIYVNKFIHIIEKSFSSLDGDCRLLHLLILNLTKSASSTIGSYSSVLPTAAPAPQCHKGHNHMTTTFLFLSQKPLLLFQIPNGEYFLLASIYCFIVISLVHFYHIFLEEGESL